MNNIIELYETEKDRTGPPADGDPAWCGYLADIVPSIAFGGFIAMAVNAFNPCAPNLDLAYVPGLRPVLGALADQWRPQPHK